MRRKPINPTGLWSLCIGAALALLIFAYDATGALSIAPEVHTQDFSRTFHLVMLALVGIAFIVYRKNSAET